MKLLVVAASVDMSDRSGDAVHLRSLLRRWREDHDVSVVSATAPADCPPGLADCIDVSESVPFLPAILGEFFGALAGIARLRSKACYDVLYVRHDLLGTGTLGTLGASGKRILEINGDLADEHRLRGSLSDPMARALRAYERILFSLADRIISVSPVLAKRLSVRAVDEESLFVVENGCDTDQFAPRANAKGELGWDPACAHVGFVGSLAPWHGLEQVVEAMDYVVDSHPEARLVVVGDGPMREALEQQVADLDLTENVEFVGSVPHDRVPVYMSAFDVGTILKHPDIPGSPLKLFEYLACGTPVVATDDEDFALLDRDDVGCRVSYDDPQAIAAGISSVLAADDDIAKRARETALDHSWDSVAKDTLEVARTCQ